MRLFFIVLFIAFVTCACNNSRSHARASASDKIQTGDIIFQVSESAQSEAIQLATSSRYSHVGIIYQKGDEYYVYEAVQTVRLTPFEEWVKRGENEHYVVKRLKNADEVLTPEIFSKLKESGEKHIGKTYDVHFEWSDDRIYCSELVWKMYKDAVGIEIGKLQSIHDFDLSDDVVSQKMKERFGDELPQLEEVITPVAIFESEYLITVIEQ